MTFAPSPIGQLTSGQAGKNEPTEAMRAAAEEFESVFIAQVLRGMSSGLEADGPLGGNGDDPFSSMLQDEYARLISRSGGIGVADAVLREMLKTQEIQ